MRNFASNTVWVCLITKEMQYAQVCGNLEIVLDDLVKHLQAIKAQIPLAS